MPHLLFHLAIRISTLSQKLTVVDDSKVMMEFVSLFYSDQTVLHMDDNYDLIWMTLVFLKIFKKFVNRVGNSEQVSDCV